MTGLTWAEEAWEAAQAKRDAAAAATVHPIDGDYDDQPAANIGTLYPQLDWREIWDQNAEGVQWLVEPIIERGRLYAMFSAAKVGKSLITLDMVASLATGRPVLGRPASDPIHVVYVDMENSPADLVERLTDFGYGPGDLDNLHYLSFPSLPALNSKIGGLQMLAVAEHYRAELLVIDTLSRVVDGKENDSDSFHDFYRHTLVALKARGIAVIRLDHEGKDGSQGMRGSSAKTSDVDVAWRLCKLSGTAFQFQRVVSRNNHSPEAVQVARRFNPLRHEITGETGLDAGIMAVVAELDNMGIPDEYGRDKCRSVLTAAHVECSNGTLAAAIRHRKSRSEAVA